MPQNKITILTTRSIDEELIKEAASNNIVVDTISFIKTEPILSVETQQEIENALLLTATVVFTSVNAVEAVAAELDEQRPEWRIFCTNHATRFAAEKAFGKKAIAGTAGNAAQLAEVIIEKGDIDEIIFFCGDQRRDELPRTLSGAGIEVTEIVVYQTVALAQRVEKKYGGILFFSPSAVKSFFQKNELPEQTVLFAIGDTTANELKEYSNNKIIVNRQADTTLFLRSVIQYFQKNRIHY